MSGPTRLKQLVFWPEGHVMFGCEPLMVVLKSPKVAAKNTTATMETSRNAKSTKLSPEHFAKSVEGHLTVVHVNLAGELHIRDQPHRHEDARDDNQSCAHRQEGVELHSRRSRRHDGPV